MTANGFLQLAIFFLALLAVTKPLGVYMARVFSGERTFMETNTRPRRAIDLSRLPRRCKAANNTGLRTRRPC